MFNKMKSLLTSTVSGESVKTFGSTDKWNCPFYYGVIANIKYHLGLSDYNVSKQVSKFTTLPTGEITKNGYKRMTITTHKGNNLAKVVIYMRDGSEHTMEIKHKSNNVSGVR